MDSELLCEEDSPLVHSESSVQTWKSQAVSIIQPPKAGVWMSETPGCAKNIVYISHTLPD